jgi:prepilin-type N-terminal cleavage/methylation domain-containing protein
MMRSAPSANSIPAAHRKGGFTLAEIMVSMAAFSMVSAALLLASTSLRRNASAVSDYSSDHADQMRLSDYIAMDLRRSISVGTLSTPNNVSMVIPEYMPTPAPGPTPQPTPYAPQLDGQGGVYYSALTKPSGTLLSAWLSNCTVTVSYYLQGETIYRVEGSAPPIPLADKVKDFVFTASSADNNKVIETTITFEPRFKSSGASADAIASTTFRNRTLLRNNVNVY